MFALAQVRAIYARTVLNDEPSLVHHVAMRLLLQASLINDDHCNLIGLREARVEMKKFAMQQNVANRAIQSAQTAKRRNALKHYVGVIKHLLHVTRATQKQRALPNP